MNIFRILITNFERHFHTNILAFILLQKAFIDLFYSEEEASLLVDVYFVTFDSWSRWDALRLRLRLELTLLEFSGALEENLFSFLPEEEAMGN